MWKKLVVVGGIIAATGLGIGGVALAQSNSGSVIAGSAPAVSAPANPTPASPAPGAKAAKVDRAGKRDALAKRLLKVAHAQWVSKDGKTGAFVTHDAIRGTVSAVSATSITVKSADSTSETFVVNGSTKVRVKGAGKSGTIAGVKVGDEVGVLGTGAGPMTATHVLDRGVPSGTR